MSTLRAGTTDQYPPEPQSKVLSEGAETETQDGHLVLTPEEVLLQDIVPIRAQTSQTTPDSLSKALYRATISRTGAAIQQSRRGDSVIVFLDPSTTDAIITATTCIAVKSTDVCKAPTTVTIDMTSSLAIAIVVAATILNKQLSIPCRCFQSPTTKSEAYAGRSILVVGGETELGVAMVMLLAQALSDCKIVAVSEIKDQDLLLQRSVHLVGLGAIYAIDRLASDLSSHLKAAISDSVGFDVMIDTGDSISTSLEELLVGPKTIIVPELSFIEGERAGSLVDVIGGMEQIGEFLRTAADVLSIYTVAGCDLAPD